MKNRNMLHKILFLFFCIIGLSNCSSELGTEKNIQTTKLFVSAQTGFYKWGDFTEDVPTEGMKIKETENDDWSIVPFNQIANFEYEKGYDYELLVEKIASTDSNNYRYKLIKLLDKQKATGETKTVQIYISAETGLYKSGDLTQDIPSIEGMKIREIEDDDWNVVPFNKIAGFNYEKGYNYKLLVEKTTIIDKPIYVNSTTYQLIEVLSKVQG